MDRTISRDFYDVTRAAAPRGPAAPAYGPASDQDGRESRWRTFEPYANVRAAVGFGLACVLLVTTFPLLILAVLIVRLTSRGPAIYRQTRVGRNGRTYTIFKIRSMRHDCERRSGPQWSTGNDPRVTPFGRFLRRTHIDELPQLWNVLRGEMSLIGPRPERPEFVSQLEKVIPGYRGREGVLPGVTGLAQIQLPPDTDLDSVRRKLACDLYYVERGTLWLDLRIVVCTGLKVFGVPCERSCQLLGIPTELGSVAGAVRPAAVAEPGCAACDDPALVWSQHAEPRHAVV
jgi:lipopolysaccharide/colanic/teichoic acid biosynthesis glycosyltransferase